MVVERLYQVRPVFRLIRRRAGEYITDPKLISGMFVTTQVPSAGMVQVLDRGVPVSAL